MHERTARDKRNLLAKRLETRQKVPYWRRGRVAVKVADECEFESARHAAARTLTLFLG